MSLTFWPLEKRLQGFLHNTVHDVKWDWKKKARLVHATAFLCFISVVNQISNLSFMSPFQFWRKSRFLQLSRVVLTIQYRLVDIAGKQVQRRFLPKIYDCQITLLIIPSLSCNVACVRGRETRPSQWLKVVKRSHFQTCFFKEIGASLRFALTKIVENREIEKLVT